MDGGARWAAVHGVANSRTWQSDFTFTFHFHALEKEMATHSSVLAWRIPGTGEPGGLPSVGSHRVGHDWSDLAAAAAAMLRLNISCHLGSPCRACFPTAALLCSFIFPILWACVFWSLNSKSLVIYFLRRVRNNLALQQDILLRPKLFFKLLKGMLCLVIFAVNLYNGGWYFAAWAWVCPGPRGYL